MSPKRGLPSALEAHLGYWLRYVSNQVSHAFALKMQAKGVTVAEWVILRELYGQEAQPSALAARLGMTRGAISRLADRLVAKKLVTRTAADGDGRAQILALTASGAALVPVLAKLADGNDAEFFDHLDARARATIVAAMKEIVRRRGLKAVPLD